MSGVGWGGPTGDKWLQTGGGLSFELETHRALSKISRGDAIAKRKETFDGLGKRFKVDF